MFQTMQVKAISSVQNKENKQGGFLLQKSKSEMYLSNRDTSGNRRTIITTANPSFDKKMTVDYYWGTEMIQKKKRL